jgi:hypothetical protein
MTSEEFLFSPFRTHLSSHDFVKAAIHSSVTKFLKLLIPHLFGVVRA